MITILLTNNNGSDSQTILILHTAMNKYKICPIVFGPPSQVEGRMWRGRKRETEGKVENGEGVEGTEGQGMYRGREVFGEGYRLPIYLRSVWYASTVTIIPYYTTTTTTTTNNNNNNNNNDNLRI